jgi:hypothetical protein
MKMEKKRLKEREDWDYQTTYKLTRPDTSRSDQGKYEKK